MSALKIGVDVRRGVALKSAGRSIKIPGGTGDARRGGGTLLAWRAAERACVVERVLVGEVVRAGGEALAVEQVEGGRTCDA